MSVLTEGTARMGLTIIVIIMLAWILLLFRAKKNPAKTSLDLLKGRLEKGEITQEEYEEARKKQRRN
jgi:putative membrane protein